MINPITKADLAEKWGRDSLLGKEKMKLDRACSDYMSGIFMILLIAGAYIAMAEVTSHYFCNGDLALKHIFRNITIASSVIGGVFSYIAINPYMNAKKRRNEFFKPLTPFEIKVLIQKETAHLATAKSVKTKVEAYRLQEGNPDVSQLEQRALAIDESEAARVASEGRVAFLANVAKIIIILGMTVFAIMGYFISGVQNNSVLLKTTGITSAGLVTLFLLRTYIQISQHSISLKKWQELEEARITKLNAYISELEEGTLDEA